jgi:hypothetical protein
VSFTAEEIDRQVADGRIATLRHVGLWLLVKAVGLAATNQSSGASIRRSARACVDDIDEY